MLTQSPFLATTNRPAGRRVRNIVMLPVCWEAARCHGPAKEEVPSVQVKPKRKPRGDGHERFKEIIDAAREVFREHGFHDTTMRRVATKAHISPAALYVYFDSKEAILAAIRDEAFGEFNRYTRHVASRAAGPEDRLRQHLHAYLDYAKSDPDVYRLTFRSHLLQAPRPGRPTGPGAPPGLEAFTILVEAISALIAHISHHDADPRTAHVMAEAAWAAIHGLSSLAIDVPDFPSSGLEASFDELVHMIVSGILARNVARSLSTASHIDSADHK